MTGWLVACMNDERKLDKCENQKIEWEPAEGMDEWMQDLLTNPKSDRLID